MQHKELSISAISVQVEPKPYFYWTYYHWHHSTLSHFLWQSVTASKCPHFGQYSLYIHLTSPVVHPISDTRTHRQPSATVHFKSHHNTSHLPGIHPCYSAHCIQPLSMICFIFCRQHCPTLKQFQEYNLNTTTSQPPPNLDCYLTIVALLPACSINMAMVWRISCSHFQCQRFQWTHHRTPISNPVNWPC